MEEARSTRLYRSIERQLSGTLAEYIAERRPETSWRDLSADLYTRTGVEVSHEALRSWFPESASAA